MTRLPSKLGRGAILTAFTGVISIGISPGTFAIVVTGVSASFGELVGVNGVLTVASDPQPAVNISTASAGSASYSGLLNSGLLLADAPSDVDGLPRTGSAPADATVNGPSPGLPSLSRASLSSFGARSVGSTAFPNGYPGSLTSSGRTSLAGASLSVAGLPIVIAASPAPNTVAIDSGDCSDEQKAQRENPQEDSTEALHENDWCVLKGILNEQVVSGDGIGSGSVTVNDGESVISNSQVPSGNAGAIAAETQATLTPAQEVPAPATLLLLLGGLPGLLLLRRRGRPIDDSTD